MMHTPARANAGNGYLVNQHLAHVDRPMDALSGPRPGLYNTTSYRPGATRSLAQG